ncbi:MAG: hypothetical protein JNK03_13825 [Nitrospira sp.]|nr:hypothetical protein [Nitrospira sp.]
MALIQWFFTETIYGIFLLCLPIYGMAWVIKKGFKAAPDPSVISVLAGIVLAVTVPSIPRYQFQAEGLRMAQEHPEYKLAWTFRYGDILEPLTLINTPIGFFKFVNPDPLTYKAGEGGDFHTVILRYKEDRQQMIVHALCENKTMSISKPDSSGVYRHTTERESEMSDQDKEIYCHTDYSEQVKFMRAQILSSKK